MRTIFSIIRFIFVTAALVVAHIAVNSLFSFPYSTVNVLMVVFCIHILLFEKGRVIWLAFATHFLIELYGTLPFGITLFSGTMAVLIGFWLFEAFFTNRSWYTATALSASIFVVYRLMYTVLLFIMQQISVQEVSWIPLFVNFAWELALSTLVVTVLYLAVQRYQKKPAQKQSIFMRI